ncbi:tRNA adenosine(34) deaminase TadA [Candidatus Contubernalis alkaliaceticus]|uniref:tRNA adenosine(34) deaminase TadA n=1 Tax=Candidatus Contubernalis alkaliaceticus TaxID=338645 RepID=UPI001F4C3D61|nr:tRNA adenosine(34) deaminase TadA [Candidatus Contubernalis alkalaceticus]UNC90644.1 tRNA adenosine(34) deaminase TadA [Candidatus Contubernalis alkalaceticus]
MLHEYFMRAALEEAQNAFEKGEVPIGAVLVKDGQVIVRAHNLKEERRDPTAHAEILVIQKASQIFNSWRLAGTTLYVTIEPCPMCAGALIQARVGKLVFGARDVKAGVCGSLYNLVQDNRFNHCLEIEEGILKDSCAEIMQRFFKERRK